MVRLLVPWSPVSQMPGNGVSPPVTDVDEDDLGCGSQDYFFNNNFVITLVSILDDYGCGS